MYQYNKEEFKKDDFTKKITSRKLADNLPETCLKFIEEWRIPNDESKVNTAAMKDITEAAYHYGFVQLKECLLKAIGTNFWCGTSDEEIL